MQRAACATAHDERGSHSACLDWECQPPTPPHPAVVVLVVVQERRCDVTTGQGRGRDSIGGWVDTEEETEEGPPWTSSWVTGRGQSPLARPRACHLKTWLCEGSCHSQGHVTHVGRCDPALCGPLPRPPQASKQVLAACLVSCASSKPGLRTLHGGSLLDVETYPPTSLPGILSA